MSSSTSEPRTRDDLPDGRNGRVVGEKDDNVLESIGKAVIAPVEGADEGAEPVDAGTRPRVRRPDEDLAARPVGHAGTPTAPKPQGKAL